MYTLWVMPLSPNWKAKRKTFLLFFFFHVTDKETKHKGKLVCPWKQGDQLFQCVQGRGVSSTWVCGTGPLCWAHRNELVDEAQKKDGNLNWANSECWEDTLRRKCTKGCLPLGHVRTHAGHHPCSGSVHFIHVDSQQDSTHCQASIRHWFVLPSREQWNTWIGQCTVTTKTSKTIFKKAKPNVL